MGGMMISFEQSSKLHPFRLGFLAVTGLLAFVMSANLASADAPRTEYGNPAGYYQDRDHTLQRVQANRENEPLPWQSKAQYESDVWSFCQRQRRICINACATFFRGRPNCTQTCSNTAHSCTETACFDWKPTHWRVVARSGGQVCIN